MSSWLDEVVRKLIAIEYEKADAALLARLSPRDSRLVKSYLDGGGEAETREELWDMLEYNYQVIWGPDGRFLYIKRKKKEKKHGQVGQHPARERGDIPDTEVRLPL